MTLRSRPIGYDVELEDDALYPQPLRNNVSATALWRRETFPNNNAPLHAHVSKGYASQTSTTP